MNFMQTKDKSSCRRSRRDKQQNNVSRKKVVETSPKLRRISMKIDVTIARKSIPWWLSIMRELSFALDVVSSQSSDLLTSKMRHVFSLTLKVLLMHHQIVYRQSLTAIRHQITSAPRLAEIVNVRKSYRVKATLGSMDKKRTFRMAQGRSDR